MRLLGLAAYSVVVTAVAGVNVGEGSGLSTALVDYYEDADGEINSLFSTLSIETCFSLVYPGAAGDTAEQIAATLAFDASASGEAVFDSYVSLNNDIETRYDGAVLPYDEGQRARITSANTIFVDDELQLLQSYADIVGHLVNVIDMQANDAEAIINAWCANATNGLITQVVDDVDEMALVAVNAVYLNATWQNKFDRDDSTLGNFYEHSGEGALVVADDTVFMHQIEDFPHAVVDGFDVVKMNYQSGELSMVIVVPTRGNEDPDELSESVVLDVLSSSDSPLETKAVALSLPKFRYRGSYLLNDVLESEGMVDAFDPQAADFSQMATVPMFISQVIHKSYIDVWEEGTEAAAVTAVLAEITSAPAEEPPPTLVVADVPFQFFIYDGGSETLIFNGKVFNPQTPDAGSAQTMSSSHRSCEFWTSKFATECPVASTANSLPQLAWGAAVFATIAATIANLSGRWF